MNKLSEILLALSVFALCACGKKATTTPATNTAAVPAPAPAAPQEVVIYTALDRVFSEPILQTFEKKSGIRVLAVYDTEVDKSVGLVNKLRAERERPRCDVFWNNEIVNTLRLKKEGVLAPCAPATAKDYPDVFRDKDMMWYGFAGRARVFLVNNQLVPAGQEPQSLRDLAKPEWKGKAALARPLAGTTATHAACLFALWGDDQARQFFRDLKLNGIQIDSGNKKVAESVSAGRVAAGLTDTDDAIIEVESGKPVRIVYPDAEGDGVLFIPNTLSLIKGAPHAEAGLKLIEHLLSAEVESALARSASAQIPLGKGNREKPRISTPQEVKPMAVDFGKAAESFDSATQFIRDEFLAP